MPKKIGYKTYNDLVSAPIPSATKSYTPISHEDAIELIEDKLDNYGYEVIERVYRANDGCQQAYGYFTFRIPEVPELTGVYAFQNSYDKTMRFTGAVGVVLDNDAIVICNSETHKRKHTGLAFADIQQATEEQIGNASVDVYYMKGICDKFSEASITKVEHGRLVGELSIEGFLMPDQATSAIREWDLEDNGTVWDSYKVIAQSVQQTTPLNWMKHLSRLHWYMLDYHDQIVNAVAIPVEEKEELEEGFDNTTIDDHDDLISLNSSDQPEISGIPDGNTMSDTNDEPIDPAQVDLEDSIADVEAEEEDNQVTVTRLPDLQAEDSAGEEEESAGVDLQSIPNERLEDSVEEEDCTYVPVGDLYGMNVGDFVEIGGMYYKYADTIVIDDEVYGKCEPIQEENSEQEELPIEVQESVQPSEEPEIQWAEPPEDPRVRTALEKEIFKVYGSGTHFKFEKVNSKYLIKLEQGTHLTLDEEYINSVIED